MSHIQSQKSRLFSCADGWFASNISIQAFVIYRYCSLNLIQLNSGNEGPQNTQI